MKDRKKVRKRSSPMQLAVGRMSVRSTKELFIKNVPGLTWYMSFWKKSHNRMGKPLCSWFLMGQDQFQGGKVSWGYRPHISELLEHIWNKDNTITTHPPSTSFSFPHLLFGFPFVPYR